MAKLKLLSVLGAVVVPALALAQANHYDFWISSSVFGEPLTIGGSYKFAGAISSLYWRNREFVNVDDHGREIQTAASFNGLLECYNPTQAGNNHDGDTSSSQLVSPPSTAANVMQTSTRMAFWLSPGDFSETCGQAQNTSTFSEYQTDNQITIGYAGIPNVIEYLTTFWVSEHVTNGQVEAIFGAFNDLTQAWRYDLTTKEYSKLWERSGMVTPLAERSGEQDAPIVLCAPTADRESCIAFYSPEALQPYDVGSTAFGWALNDTSTGGAARIFHRFGAGYADSWEFGPGHQHYRSYLVVGTRTEVQSSLNQLHYVFHNLDPDVFDWRDYLDMYPEVAVQFPGASGAQTHWLTYGIGEGRSGSRSFSPPKYLQLYNLGDPTNYQFALDHYVLWGRDEGRSTVKKAEAGFRHSTVLSTGLPSSAGLNNYGQLGNGSVNDSTSPVGATGLSSIMEVADGPFTSLAVRFDGTLWAWGSNQYGQLGNGSANGYATQPVQVPNITVITPTPKGRHVIGCGYTASATLDQLGQVWTWGANSSGELGDGTTTPHYIPMRVRKSGGDYLTDIVSIATGYGKMIALDAHGRVWAWGSGAWGGLGQGPVQTFSPYALQVLSQESDPAQACVPPKPGTTPTPLVNINQIASGGWSDFALAVANNGELFVWGDNRYGQLALPESVVSKSYATRISECTGESGFSRIAAGDYHALGISRFHSTPNHSGVLGWGYNGFGALGSSSAATIQRAPHEMDEVHLGPHGMGPITDVAAGANFSLMLRSGDPAIFGVADRAVFGVGDNAAGQLGIGNTAQQNIPVLTNF